MAHRYQGKDHQFPLSQYQRDIIDRVMDWRTGGNLVVQAVAGSGKTATLEAVAKYLPTKWDSLFCAFNRHIRDELAERLQGYPVSVRTIHGVGFAGLRYFAKRQGVKLGKDYLDPSKYHHYAKAALDLAIESGIVHTWSPDRPGHKTGRRSLDRYTMDALQELYPLADVKRLVGLCRVKLIDTDTIDEDTIQDLAHNYGMDVDPDIERFVTLAVRECLHQGEANILRKIDYTDMVWAPWLLDLSLYKHPWVLVDECQDLSAAQLDIVLRSVWTKGGRLLFVGDRAQAIYGFAGAGVDSVDRIVRKTHATELPLSICYRCPKSHVELAAEIVPQIEAAPWAVEGEITDVKHSDVSSTLETGDLVLCRKTAPLISLCYSLISDGIGARVRGRSIGDTIANLMEKVARPKRSFRFQDFPARIDAWSEKRIQKALAKTGGDVDDPAIDAIDDQADCMRMFFDISEASTLEGLQDEVRALFADDGDNPQVWLSTVHRAKGLEADRVYILEPGCMPMPGRTEWQREQEMNLVYVAYTRAKVALRFIVEDSASLDQDDSDQDGDNQGKGTENSTSTETAPAASLAAPGFSPAHRVPQLATGQHVASGVPL